MSLRPSIVVLFFGCAAPGEVHVSHLGAYPGAVGGLTISAIGRTGSPLALGEDGTEVGVQTRPSGGTWADAASVTVDFDGPAHIDVALVADNSGSEQGYLGNIEDASAAFGEAILGRSDGDRVALIRVSTVASTLTGLTDDEDAWAEAVDAQHIGNGWTALWDGVRLAGETLEEGAVQAEGSGLDVCLNQSVRSIVAFTDGEENNSADEHETSYEGDGVDSTALDISALTVHDAVVPVHFVGVGDEIDAVTLSEIAENSDGSYAEIDDYTDLLESLDDTAVYLAGEVPVCFEAASCSDDEARITVAVTDPDGGELTAEFELDLPGISCGCTLTQGYWKTHEEDWPVSELTLGETTYDQDALLEILDMPVRGDTSLQLAHQLIAARLNILSGATDSEIAEVIEAADAWLVAHDPGDGLPFGKKVGTGSDGGDIATALDDWNNGDTGPGHCG